jgi:peptide chain release factor 3
MPTATFEDQDFEIARELSRRRTFAIISHPDAGKTTLTEKLLLYAGAIEMAGSVRPKRTRSHATSDWMALEQARGISVTSTVLQFQHAGCLFNLLDTPGHQDFSEDTYRTLTAVDSAVMVLDAAKGIEPQTRKLFEVCRSRRVPILTFINKMDQPSRDPLALLDEIEKTLGLAAAPVNWPVGSGPDFRGLCELGSRRVLIHSSSSQQVRSEPREFEWEDPEFERTVREETRHRLMEDLELIAGAGAVCDHKSFLAGEMTPVFFGSALKNFGVEVFLKALVEFAPQPMPRLSSRGLIAPGSSFFSAFVFKIQANMDPLHRDRMAFLRICSGRFERDMLVHHHRLGRKIRMTRMHRLFAQERETIEVAFPGDVVGVVNPGVFAIGDTLSTGEPLRFEAVPRFQPEHFGVLRIGDVAKSKQFHKGVTQLEEEGVVQVLRPLEGGRRDVLVAAVGKLQFDVVESRLLSEYGVSTAVSPLPYACARWVHGQPKDLRRIAWPSNGVLRTEDREGRLVCLFSSLWELEYLRKEHPEVRFQETG